MYEKSYADVLKSYFDLLPKDNSRAEIVLSPSYQYASDDLSKNFKRLIDPNTFFVIEDARGVYYLRQTGCQVCKNAFRFGRSESRSSGLLFERHRDQLYKIGLPGKSILGDYFQENRTSRRHFLLLRISFPGKPILYKGSQGPTV